ncbi:MAG TPA: 4Fe-4S dicluster domain-containing protein [Archaeoglobaceae archaeon]|nr:4Fe-4S dicluster domain-containing protein [Archaeoglobaceae archaeon]
MELTLDEELCTGCGNCAIACPVNFPLLYDIKKELRIENGRIRVSGEMCNGCGVCVESCSFNALELRLPVPPEIEKIEEIFESVERSEKILRETKLEIIPELIEVFENTKKPFSTGLLRRIFEGESINIEQIKNFILDFEEKGNVFRILEELIIEKDLCSLCGGCVTACSAGVIEIVDYVPKLVGDCVNCATCYLICPKTRLFRPYDFTSKERILSARSMRKDILSATKQGGAATSILVYALEKRIIDCAIVMIENNPVIATKPEDIIRAAGVKFGISPNVSMLRKAIEMGYGKIALVGVPCNVRAVRNIQSVGLEELKLVFGVFCPRGSHPEKKTNACKFCTDLTAELSDISVGGIGSLKGWRTLIVRTEVGEEILKGALREGYLQVKEIDEEGLAKLRKMSEKKKKGGSGSDGK